MNYLELCLFSQTIHKSHVQTNIVISSQIIFTDALRHKTNSRTKYCKWLKLINFLKIYFNRLAYL